MKVFPGTAISGNVFIGKAMILHRYQYPHFRKKIDPSETESELDKLRSARTLLEEEINSFLHDSDLSQLDKDILGTHLMILNDIEITQILREAVEKDLMSAPQAVLSAYEGIIKNFRQMENSYFAQRADDYRDVAHRLMMILLNAKGQIAQTYNPEDIIFTDDITPSLVSSLSKAGAKAYCTEHGSLTSHSSILTRAFGLTAMVGPEGISSDIREGHAAILDPEESRIIIEPDAGHLAEYKQKVDKTRQKIEKLKAQEAGPATTKNNVTVNIKANIEYPEEAGNVLEHHCDGIGLFRTEFIFLNRPTLPDEEEQYSVYAGLLSRLHDLPVIIRTFDLGGDKLAALQQAKREDNPYLGCRGIRLSINQPKLFKTQIRAILRASVKGRAAIMFPMVISLEDFLAAHAVVNQCKDELAARGIGFDSNIPIGAMIETPSAALCADQLAQRCDFFSLGTNDLVQYTLAVDRNNEKVAPYYIQHHPAVLTLIRKTVEAAAKAGIPLSVCGEMASVSRYVPLLIGMGISELSINPDRAAEVKAIVRSCDQHLFNIVQGFDLNTGIADVEHLLDVTLRPYHSFQS